MRREPSTLTMKEIGVQTEYLKTLSRESKKSYKKNSLKYQRNVLNKFNEEPIEHYADYLELIAEKEYLDKLDRDGKKAYNKKSTLEQHSIIDQFRENKKPKVSYPEKEEQEVISEPIREPIPENNLPEPEVYDFDDIASRIKEYNVYDEKGNVKITAFMNEYELEKEDAERYADISTGEQRYYWARSILRDYEEELSETLSDLQRKNPNFKVATTYTEVPVNYHNQRFFDAIKELTEGVDVYSLTPYEIEEIKAESIPFEAEILTSQPTKVTKQTPAKKTVKDSKLVEYIKSVEESLNNNVIDSDYAKQSIISYLEENL